MGLVDLTGKRFGRLTVIRRDGEDKFLQAMWLCECDCGIKVRVRGRGLRTGNTKSCGCYRNEATIATHTTHGMRHSRIYNVWHTIKARCFNENNPSYHLYGGRGITVCDEWREFVPFYEWAMANGYEENLSIVRINNDGNYEPSNCRWR